MNNFKLLSSVNEQDLSKAKMNKISQKLLYGTINSFASEVDLLF